MGETLTDWNLSLEEKELVVEVYQKKVKKREGKVKIIDDLKGETGAVKFQELN